MSTGNKSSPGADRNKLFVIDIGNTQTVLGVFDGDRLRKDWRIATDKAKTADEYCVLLENLFKLSGLTFDDFNAVAISCVVPPLLSSFEDFCRKYLEIVPLVIGPGVRTGMPILYDNPREVGADRIVNSVAAYHRVHRSCIVVDFGTATTFDCISGKGEYLGGVIVPGVGISLEALCQHASKLPRVEIARPKTVIGKNTVNSMQSGIFFGYGSLIDGIVVRIRDEMNEEPYVMATGGMAERISPVCKTIQEVDQFLTLEGLKIIYELNLKEGE